jgi:hypothetical protein
LWSVEGRRRDEIQQNPTRRPPDGFSSSEGRIGQTSVLAWHSDGMGYGYDAICKSCGTRFSVSEGSGMVAMPFHCDQCGKEWWWEFGPGGPMGKEAAPPPCECGGTFREDASPRCPNCRSAQFVHDPDGSSMTYD